MISRVRDTIRRYNMITGGDKIFAAVSGGADSVCLLLVLDSLREELNFSLEAIHVEHGIRGKESEEDALFVQKLCEKLGIRCHIYRVDAPKLSETKGYSIEEAARMLRYECFDKHTGDGKVATAHHSNDNAETILYNMIRGTGIEGLRGIKKLRGPFIRPLIEIERQDIETFLEEQGQDYRIDSTNSETTYARNNIRHNIFPKILEINEGAVTHLSQLSNRMDLVSEYIDKQSDKVYGKCVSSNKISHKLLSEDLIIVQTVIHKFLADMAGSSKDITNVHIEAVLGLLSGGAGREAHLPYNMRARAEYDSVIIVKEDTEQEVISAVNIMPNIHEIGDSYEAEVCGMRIRLEILEYLPNMEIVSKTYTKMLDYDKIINKLCIRNRRAGDYLLINGNGDKKSLNRYMIDAKIVRDERDRIPLICDGSHVMYIVGHRISEHYKIAASCKTVLKIDVIKGAQ